MSHFIMSHCIKTTASSLLKFGEYLHAKSDNGGRFAITYPKSKRWQGTTLSLLAVLAFPIALQAGSAERSPVRDSTKNYEFTAEFQPQSCRPQGHHSSSFRTFVRHHDSPKPDGCYVTENGLGGCSPIVTDLVIRTSAAVESPAQHLVESPANTMIEGPAERLTTSTGSPTIKAASPITVPPAIEAVCLPVVSVESCDSTCCATGTPPALAELIHRSQTASYGWERRDAIHKLSDKFDCKCHPEVMTALLFALNDSDERVRSKTADEIGDQLRVNPGCCTPTVLNALQYAMGDCDRFVRRQAEEALRAAGYDFVDGCCQLRRLNAEVTCAPVQVPLSVNLPAIRSTHRPSGAPILQKSAIVPPTAGPAIPSVTRPALFPLSVPVDDATPTQPAAEQAVAPPPLEKPVSFSSPAATPDIHQTNAPTRKDAPVPLSTGLAGSRGQPATGNDSGSSTHRLSSARNRPLRKSLSHLFN